HDGGAAVQGQADARHRRGNPGVFRDLALLVERDVQIGANEHALALQLALLGQLGQCHDPAHAYLADIKATVVSSMRLLKPHSLSYQDVTLTRLPMTLVSVASKLLEAGLWLKSTDTSGSSL